MLLLLLKPCPPIPIIFATRRWGLLALATTTTTTTKQQL
jgi:hypothetical protein